MSTKDDKFVVTPNPHRRVGFQGYLQNDGEDQIWICNADGTWIINKDDIVGRTEWTGVADKRFTGKPLTVYVKGDAEIFEIRAVKLKALRAWPPAIAPAARACSETKTDMKTAMYFNEMLEAETAATITRSLKPDTTGWGSVYGKDD